MLCVTMPVRIQECQLIMLSERARTDPTLQGYLDKRAAGAARWQTRWFVLYQNLLFYYENETSPRPGGLIFLEGCYCEPVITANTNDPDNPYRFEISYTRPNQRHYELRSSTESLSILWVQAIQEASFNKLLEQKVELEQKNLHLLEIYQIVQSTKCDMAKQCKDADAENKKLLRDLEALRKERKPSGPPSFSARPMVRRAMSQGTGSLFNAAHDMASGYSELSGITESFDMDIEKIKKVQSLLRGWLCRRRWKHIVEKYIKSPHAETMRERNRLVFQMVETEEEYTEHLEVLVSCFLRPFKMAASSKKPPCSHEDVNSIFLNSETLLFLHQIFLKGLTSRMESWPTLVLGDLFDMLLPMLSIYQEYVRNHNYSLQILTERKQSSPSFKTYLNKLEKQYACRGRMLETFLLYPMQQINKYVITLRALVDKTPHDHVELQSLTNAKQSLEDLSRQIHDEESVTENLRKNLSVERMIVQGCDILLDVNQVFVRQGPLVQILDKYTKSSKPKGAISRLNATLGKGNTEKEAVRKCFLFSYHLLLTTQDGDSGPLNLVPQIGKIALTDIVSIEDPTEQVATDDDELSVCSMSSDARETASVTSQYPNRDFKIFVDTRTGGVDSQITIHLVAPTMQEKTAWVTDLNQCLDNVQYNSMHHGSLSDTASATMPPSVATDLSLHTDDRDMRFSKILDSCKIPQVREATPERLLHRLTDFTFISIDFLNTFLLTYRVFTDGVAVLENLKKVFYETEPPNAPMPSDSIVSLDAPGGNAAGHNLNNERRRSSGASPRRTSGASSVSGYGSEVSESRDVRSHSSYDSNCGSHMLNSKEYWKSSHKKDEQQLAFISEASAMTKRSPMVQSSSHCPSPKPQKRISIRVDKEDESDSGHLTIPKVIADSSSSETLTDNTVVSAASSPSNLSSATLVGSTVSDSRDHSPQDVTTCSETASEEAVTPIAKDQPKHVPCKTAQAETQTDIVGFTEELGAMQPSTPHKRDAHKDKQVWDEHELASTSTQYHCHQDHAPLLGHRHRASVASAPSNRVRSSSISTITASNWSTKPGVVITSFRQGHRRSSTSTAATAFAMATSASSNPPDRSLDDPPRNGSCREKNRRKESVMSTAATTRVLNVLRHWISKQAQDFERDPKLKAFTVEFLDNIVHCPNLLQVERKTASQLRRLITKEEPDFERVDLKILLTPPSEPTKESIETLSAMDIAEQMTYLDHQIFVSIGIEEFLEQAFAKEDKETRAPNITLMAKRFNEVSMLVVSEIVRRSDMSARVKAIEKWAAVADINRVWNNYNGVSQIQAAFKNSAVFRLTKTWEKVSKTTCDTISKLNAIFPNDGRFKNMRDALQKCVPPCIPFLGPYLTHLTFIEEATPKFNENGLLNFSKMKMIANVIGELRQFQQTPYNIKFKQHVANYLLDPSLRLTDVYALSLKIQPQHSLGSSSKSSGAN